MITIFVVMGWLVDYFRGQPFRPTRMIVLYGVMVVCLVWLLGAMQRQAQGKPKWQFQLRDILVLITVIGVILAAGRWERDYAFGKQTERQTISDEIVELTGARRVSVSGNPGSTMIFAFRSTFGDGDLDKLVQLTDRLNSLDAPITFLDLSGTQITDQGAAALASLDSLEFCFLDKTQVSDQAVDELQQLQHLKVLSVRNTGVSVNRLKQLSIDRPDLDIEPKTYQVKRP